MKTNFQLQKTFSLCKRKLYLIFLGTFKTAKNWVKPVCMTSVHSQPLITIWFPLALKRKTIFANNVFPLASARSLHLAESLFICRQLIQLLIQTSVPLFYDCKVGRKELNKYYSLERGFGWSHLKSVALCSPCIQIYL